MADKFCNTPPFNLYWGVLFISLLNSAVITDVSPTNNLLSGSEWVKVTRGPHDSPHLGKKEGDDAIRLRRAKFVFTGFDETHQAERSWLNASASWNISSIFATLDTSHTEISLLNTSAPVNIPCIVLTAEVSKELKSWLNTSEYQNIETIFVALEVFQFKGWPDKPAASPLLNFLASPKKR